MKSGPEISNHEGTEAGKHAGTTQDHVAIAKDKGTEGFEHRKIAAELPNTMAQRVLSEGGPHEISKPGTIFLIYPSSPPLGAPPNKKFH